MRSLNQPPSIPEMLSRRQVAQHLNKSVSTLNRMLASGDFPRGAIVGNRECWPASDVADYLNERIKIRDERGAAA